MCCYQRLQNGASSWFGCCLLNAADLAALDSVLQALQASLDAATTEPSIGGGDDPIAAPAIVDASKRQQGQSFSMGLVAKFADLLQLRIADIHVRLECNFLSPSGTAVRPPFSVGVVLASLSVGSLDIHGNSTQEIRGASALSFIRKRLLVEGFGIYLDHGDAYRAGLAKAEIGTQMRTLMGLGVRFSPQQLAVTSGKSAAVVVHSEWTPTIESSLSKRRFLLMPLSVDARVVINDSGQPPKTELLSIMRFVPAPRLSRDPLSVRAWQLVDMELDLWVHLNSRVQE